MGVTVRIGSAILNEYDVRCVWEHEEWSGFPDHTGRNYVDEQTAKEMLADAAYQADPKLGPEHDASTRAAYRRLRDQLRKTLGR